MGLALARRGARASSRRRTFTPPAPFIAAADPASGLPISVRASNLKNSTATSATPSFTVPAETMAADLIVAVLGATIAAPTPPPPPAGWAMALPVSNAGGTNRGTLAVYYKVATGTPGQVSTDAGTTVTLSSTQNRAYSVFVTVTAGSTKPPRVAANFATAGSYTYAPMVADVAAGGLAYTIMRSTGTLVATGAGTQFAAGTPSGTGAAPVLIQRLDQVTSGATGIVRFSGMSGSWQSMTVVID